jgi:ATP-dependent exoDNAse (exonuclease V) alpha subunit
MGDTTHAQSTFAHAPAGEITLSPEQEDAIRAIQDPTCPVTVLTGQAGSGKTTLLRAIRRRMTPPAVFTATTRRAAMPLEGTTADALFCFNRQNWEVWNPNLLNHYMGACPEVVVIDEGSMIGRRMGDLIEEIRKAYEKRIVIVGDFAQAAPVKDDWITGSKIMDDIRFIKLVENHRQADAYFCDQLNKLRVGTTDRNVDDMVRGRQTPPPAYDAPVTVLFFTNKTSAEYNRRCLQQHLDTTGFRCFQLESEFIDARPAGQQRESPRGKKYVDDAITDSRFAHRAWFALGARVVCTVNAVGGGRLYANGDTGTITGVVNHHGETVYKNEDVLEAVRYTSRPALRIRLDRTGRNIIMNEVMLSARDPLGRHTHTICGLPIQLGYAITVHKAQGMTVPRVWVDFRSLGHFPDQKSRHGLAYVALSRVSSLEGLSQQGWDPELVYCDPEIKRLI